jgi:MFS family permease
MFNIQTQNSTWTKWFIWSLAAGFFFAEYIARVAPAAMEPQLMHDFAINAQEYGMLSTFFYYAYVCMQLPVGALFDRYQPLLLLALMTTVCAVGCYLFAHTHNLSIAQLGRFITGFGGAFAFVGAIKVTTIWFPARYLGMLTGATQALGMLGAALGESLTAYSIDQIGWRPSMIVIGHLLLLLALLFFITYIASSTPQKETREKTIIPTKKSSMIKNLLLIMKKKQTWINALYAGLIFAPTGAFSEVWGPTYLTNVQHLPPKQAALTNVFVFLGWAVGGPVVGHLSDVLKKRKPIMIASAIICLVLLILVLYGPKLHLYYLFSLLFLYGLANTGLIASYATATEIAPPNVSGTAIAFANMASVIVGVIFLPIIGSILDFYWQKGSIANGVRIYSQHAYHIAMFALPCCLLLAIFVACNIEETNCRNCYES